MSEGLVIVGASYAGMQIAISAREHGYAEPIRLIGNEAHPPYQRPPLSKAFLLGKFDRAQLPLRSEAFYRESAIELLLDLPVRAIDPVRKRIETRDGSLAYDHLALATGTRARLLPLPGADLQGVVTLRTLDESIALREAAATVEAIVIIGGGFIGLEVAASMAGLGKRVTVLEALPRLLARAVPPALSAFLADYHRQKGVTIRFNAAVEAIEGDGRVRAVRVGGERLPADLVLIAAGAVPNVELAAAAGLACSNGIVVDAFAATADPAIVAAGDCTNYVSAFTGTALRLESVQNAQDQAKSAGATVAGKSRPYDAVPWFWSDQHDLKLQMVGLSQGADQTVLRGNPAEGKFSLLSFRGPKLLAIDSVNRPAEHMLGRRLLAAGANPTPAQAADPSFDLKSLLAA